MVDDRVTIRDAALRLGISESAVRKRVDRVTLPHEKGEDGRVYIHLDTGVQSSTPVESNPLISEMEKRIELLERQLEAEREANRENRRIIMTMAQALRELVPATDMPSEASESDLRASEEPSRVKGREEPEEPKKRPWWKKRFKT